MNILLLAVGTRNKIVQYFKRAWSGTGQVIATDSSILAPAIYEADRYYIVPPITAPDYLDVILDICKKEKITGLLSLIDPELSLLAENRERFAEVGTIVIGSSYAGEETSGVISLGADTTAMPGISLARCLHVSGTCWFEETIDGLWDNTESVLPGVKIELDGERNGLHFETISGEDGTWRKLLTFDYIGHFSRHILPGARRIAFSRCDDRVDVTAARNPDGSVAVVLLNRGEADLSYALRLEGKVIRVSVPAHTLSTLCLPEA